jgi:hypothetical protein
MKTMPPSKEKDLELRLSLDSQSTYSRPASFITACRGSVKDNDTTMVVEHSMASTDTPSPSGLDLPCVAPQFPSIHRSGVSEEPKKIFVVKVCEVHPSTFDHFLT